MNDYLVAIPETRLRQYLEYTFSLDNTLLGSTTTDNLYDRLLCLFVIRTTEITIAEIKREFNLMNDYLIPTYGQPSYLYEYLDTQGIPYTLVMNFIRVIVSNEQLLMLKLTFNL